jgi:DNA polymerase elongation subunit (family B)
VSKLINTQRKNKPNILFFDIETTPIKAYSWGPKWQTNLIGFVDHVQVLSFSAKWFGGAHITKGWPDYKSYKPGELNDKDIVAEIWSLFNKADIILAHNGRDFDIKISNARFVFHGLTPPSPYKTVDTKVEAKKYLRLPSYGLDDLCAYFEISRKLHHEGFSLWTQCMDGDHKAWKIMLQYNKQDVIILEQLYLRLRPWMANHPNIGMYKSNIVCPKCGANSDRLNWEGWYRNKTTKYHAFSCKDCGGWGRDSTNCQLTKPVVGI